MLRRIDKNKGFNVSEEKLINLADNAFLGLWSYANIHSDEGFSKNKTGKEVCDLLVVFGDDVIIFSDKSVKFNENKDIGVAWERWFRGSVIDSSRQLYGAEKFIKENPHRLYIDKKCTMKFPVEINKTCRFHLISVTDNIAGPAKRYFDSIAKGSSATLVNAFVYDAEECLKHVFCVGDLYPSKTFIHVLDETSLTLLLTELNTATEFIEYLRAKEKAVREQRLAICLGEEEILASYLLGEKKIISDEVLREKQLVSIPEGEWLNYTNSFQYQHSISMKKGSVFWDSLIDNCSKSILAANVGYFGEKPFSMHEVAVRELAKETRKSRYYLSNCFKEKIDSVPPHITSSRLVESPDEPGKFYLLLLVPRKGEVDYLTYRENRIELIKMYLPIAFARHREIKKIVAIATETKNSLGRSEDFIYMHFPKSMPREERIEIVKATKDVNIMSDFLPWNKPAPARNYTPTHSNMQKIGRNELCFCGSGKKYKKCHG
ncbi:SEC-C motif-containing protein [Pantoea ananatis]|uniref:SEC-C metal-binding domain-containing protein n=1 Tax=Pantoea ananas TaxID=553 RepID=UPI000DC241FD|nr:SEC-C metal-binding domain-containing protein [Pantoea ananatis]RAR65435.1 SEC-C motif-containing protein [Pantoea ananatis]